MTREFERSTCQAIVQCLPDPLVLVDRDLRIVVANRAASLLFRVSLENLRGARLTALLPGDDLERWLREFGTRRSKVLETTLPAKGRGRPALTVRMTAVRLATVSRVKGLRLSAALRREFRLLVLEDISDTALLETQLVETEKQAAMGQLTAGILHEIRNPVSSLGSNLLFVRDTLTASTEPEVAQALEVSLEHLDQMRQLLGTLSAFPRRAAPRFELADVQEVIRRSVAFVAREAERRRIRLTVSFAPGPITCEMDVRQIKQVLLNLLKNAMEAMPEGGHLEVRTAYRPPDRQTAAAVQLEVEDTGIGIAESDLRRVFRPLFSTKRGSAGLGLSFCRQVVEEHGGELHVMSRGKDQGTVALVSLPIRQSVSD